MQTVHATQSHHRHPPCDRVRRRSRTPAIQCTTTSLLQIAVFSPAPVSSRSRFPTLPLHAHLQPPRNGNSSALHDVGAHEPAEPVRPLENIARSKIADSGRRVKEARPTVVVGRQRARSRDTFAFRNGDATCSSTETACNGPHSCVPAHRDTLAHASQAGNRAFQPLDALRKRSARWSRRTPVPRNRPPCRTRPLGFRPPRLPPGRGEAGRQLWKTSLGVHGRTSDARRDAEGSCGTWNPKVSVTSTALDGDSTHHATGFQTSPRHGYARRTRESGRSASSRSIARDTRWGRGRDRGNGGNGEAQRVAQSLRLAAIGRSVVARRSLHGSGPVHAACNRTAHTLRISRSASATTRALTATSTQN